MGNPYLKPCLSEHFLPVYTALSPCPLINNLTVSDPGPELLSAGPHALSRRKGDACRAEDGAGGANWLLVPQHNQAQGARGRVGGKETTQQRSSHLPGPETQPSARVSISARPLKLNTVNYGSAYHFTESFKNTFLLFVLFRSLTGFSHVKFSLVYVTFHKDDL